MTPTGKNSLDVSQGDSSAQRAVKHREAKSVTCAGTSKVHTQVTRGREYMYLYKGTHINMQRYIDICMGVYACVNIYIYRKYTKVQEDALVLMFMLIQVCCLHMNKYRHT